ncbi:hypothetical protein Tco_0228155 [Tanacetum coccineum]
MVAKRFARIGEVSELHSCPQVAGACMKRIVTAFGPGFGDWQWRLATLPFAFGGLGVYCAGDVLNYAFRASRLQSAGLQTKLLQHAGIVDFGPTLMMLCNPPFLYLLDIWICGNLKWKTTLLTGLGVFARDIYGDHVVSCAGIIGIKHRRNIVRDTLVDIYMLFYSRDRGLDVCVDLTGFSPLTQTRMVDFVPGRAVVDVAHRKRVKYESKCASIGYGFLPFTFSSLGELEEDPTTFFG